MKGRMASDVASVRLQHLAFFVLGLGVAQGILFPDMISLVCGKSSLDTSVTRVIGGRKAMRGDWPWLAVEDGIGSWMVLSNFEDCTNMEEMKAVWVSLEEHGSPICAGAILNERLVLTAAHCFISGNNPSNWRVLAGKLRTDRVEPGQKAVNIERVIIHKDFSNTTLANDIALLQLAEPLSFSTLIKPICLPRENDVPRPGEMCLLAGWGETETGEAADSLRQVSLPIIPDVICSLANWYGSDFLPKTSFCAGYEFGGRDSCIGDSGAPLICKRDTSWIIKGITSWAYDCGAVRWPGIYTDVTKYLPWIESYTRKNHFKRDDAPTVG